MLACSQLSPYIHLVFQLQLPPPSPPHCPEDFNVAEEDSADDEEDDDDDEEGGAQKGGAPCAPLDLAHVVELVDRGHHASDELLLPPFMFKRGDITTHVFKPRGGACHLNLPKDPRSKKRLDVNTRLRTELHKYYLRYGPPAYGPLWARYTNE